jgi:hypothetical protein
MVQRQRSLEHFLLKVCDLMLWLDKRILLIHVVEDLLCGRGLKKNLDEFLEQLRAMMKMILDKFR